MAAELIAALVAFWKEWGILVLVMLSFALQVILLITAEIRRRMDSGVLKVVVWSAYLLADTTAIYTLGHMSVTCMPWQEHQLMALWAPFLLLHLGGQDNITAYSIEDNRLWLRHLQSLVIQVAATVYVLYVSSIVARGSLLRPTAVLMFLVAVVKYVERVCALKLACSSGLSGKNYERQLSRKYIIRYPPSSVPEQYLKTWRAHEVLRFAKHLLKGPPHISSVRTDTMPDWEEMYGVAEIQLSLMHDVFYSKAELIHTWHGFCIRVISLLATLAALLMFRRFIEKDGYRRADVAATYVLLIGAIVLEITSLLRALFSSWTYYKLSMASHPYARALAPLALLVPRWLWSYYALAKYAACRYWSASMGQHNFIDMCSHCRDSRGSKLARWIGWEDWWNMLVYTSSVPVSTHMSELFEKQMKEGNGVDHESPEHIKNSRGQAVLKRRPGLYEELGWSVGTELDESILVWHIATHVYLSQYEEEHDDLAQVTKELSNYMMFLLAAHPYMLPNNASRDRYVILCDWVIQNRGYELNYTSSEAGMLRLIQNRGYELTGDGPEPQNIYDKGCLLSVNLISKQRETSDANMLELISQVWVEFMCHAAYWCRPDYHARQLSNGGELITIVALMLMYMKTRIDQQSADRTASLIIIPDDRYGHHNYPITVDIRGSRLFPDVPTPYGLGQHCIVRTIMTFLRRCAHGSRIPPRI